MKDKRKKQKVLGVMDVLAVAIVIAAGIVKFATTWDRDWICWVIVVILLYLRVWMALDALRRTEAEAETWRVLYQKTSNQVLDLAWENEQMRVKRTGEDGE